MGKICGKVIEDYVRYLRLLNRSPETIASYRGTIHMFDRPATKAGIEEWLESLRFRLKPGSVLVHHKNLRAFLNWCVRRGHLPANPMKGIPEPRVRPNVVEPFSPEQARALYATATSLRDRLLVAILLNTGIRIGELVALRPEDVQPGKLQIHGKGGKHRWVGINSQTEALLREYMMLSTDTVFGVKRRALYWALRRLGGRAGVTKVHPHRFRDTFAVRFLENGGGVDDLQVLLGHSSITMTLRYVQWGREQRAIQGHARYAPSVF